MALSQRGLSMKKLKRIAVLGLLCGLAWGCAPISAAAPQARPKLGQTKRAQTRTARHPKDPSQKEYGFNKVLQFETTKVEYGELKATDSPVKKSVAFKNPVAETVTVVDVTTSCPCTQAMVSTLTIPADGTGKLDIILDPKTASEKFDVLLSVEYEDTNQVDRVEIAGTVKR